MRAFPVPSLQIGGTLLPGQLYIERAADAQLLSALSQGTFCYVLAPRQIGKSSLRARTAAALRARGIRCASIDLTLSGARLSEEQWYLSLLTQIADELDLPDDQDPLPFFRAHAHLPPVGRFTRFLSAHLLPAAASPLILFIDEIDAVLALPFPRDDFFAAIRALYNRRADDPALSHLGFCLLGVAAPTDLIADPRRTPFNIGLGVPLADFSLTECRALLPRLAPLGHPEAWLHEVYRHTHGHPYMTQKLCQHLLDRGPHDDPPRQVQDTIETLFLRRGRVEDPSLGGIETAFARAHRGEQMSQMLRLYRRLLRDERVPAQGGDPIQMALRLAGAAAEREDEHGPRLCVRNPICARVFDLAWVRDKETERLFTEPLLRWQDTGKPRALVLRGEALQAALRWAQDRQDLSPDEHHFLRAGLDEARRRTRNALISALIAVLLLFGAGSYLYRRADLQRQLSSLRMRDAGWEALLRAQSPGEEVRALRRALDGLTEAQEHSLAPDPMLLRGLAAAAQTGRRSLPLRLHKEAVLWTDFSPDSERLASTAQDGTPRLWDARSGAPLAALIGHRASTQTTYVDFILFSPDGRLILTVSQDETARLWDGKTGTPVRVLRGLGPMHRAAFSPHGERVVIAAGGGATAPVDALIYQVQDGQPLVRLRGNAAWSNAIAFSPDGTRVAAATTDGTGRIWDAATGRLLATLRGPQGEAMRDVRFTPESARVLTTAQDGAARLWDAVDGRPLAVLRGHVGPIPQAQISPDGRLAATAGSDGTARLWDLRTHEERAVLSGHAGPVFSLAFTPRGDRLLTAGSDGTVRVFSVLGGQPLALLRGHGAEVTLVKVSPDGTRVATTSQDRTLRLWHGGAGGTSPVLRGHRNVAARTRFSPDGRYLLTVGVAPLALLWDGQRGSLLQTLPLDSPGQLSQDLRIAEGRFSPDTRRLLVCCSQQATLWSWDEKNPAVLARFPAQRSAMLSADGQTIAALGEDRRMRLFDGRTGALRTVLPGHVTELDLPSVRLSADGQIVLLSGGGHTPLLWDLAQGGPPRALSGHRENTYAALSADERLVLTNSFDGTAALWEVKGGKRVLHLDGGQGRLWSAALSPDGRLIATGGGDHSVKLWDARSGALLRTLRGHTQLVRIVAFSPDGARLLSASYDGTGRLWDPVDGRLRATLSGHTGEIQSAEFSPDGARIVTGAWDRTARLWDGVTGAPLAPHADGDLLVPVTQEDPPPMTPDETIEEGRLLREFVPMACRLLFPQPEFEQVSETCRRFDQKFQREERSHAHSADLGLHKR